jgi:hypothetical protein
VGINAEAGGGALRIFSRIVPFAPAAVWAWYTLEAGGAGGSFGTHPSPPATLERENPNGRAYPYEERSVPLSGGLNGDDYYPCYFSRGKVNWKFHIPRRFISKFVGPIRIRSRPCQVYIEFISLKS